MIVAIEPLGQTDRPAQNTPDNAATRTMPMDAYRDGGQLIVHFDLPGIEPDSLELHVETTSSPSRQTGPGRRSRTRSGWCPSGCTAPSPASCTSVTGSTSTSSTPATTTAC